MENSVRQQKSYLRMVVSSFLDNFFFKQKIFIFPTHFFSCSFFFSVGNRNKGGEEEKKRTLPGAHSCSAFFLASSSRSVSTRLTTSARSASFRYEAALCFKIKISMFFDPLSTTSRSDLIAKFTQAS